MRTLVLSFMGICCWASVLSSQAVPAADRNYRDLIKQAFVSYSPHYGELREDRIWRAVSLGRRVYDMEAKGGNTKCAHEIGTETKWLLGATADFRRIDQRLDALQNVLEHPDLEEDVDREDVGDGSWGRCYTEWFFKLDASYDHLNRDLRRDRKPTIPWRFLDRVNSPTKLRKYFGSVSVSNVAREGVDHRRELNESMADLMRLILRDRPVGYPWDPRLKGVLMDLILHGLRNPASAWWGERYVFAGRTEFV